MKILGANNFLWKFDYENHLKIDSVRKSRRPHWLLSRWNGIWYEGSNNSLYHIAFAEGRNYIRCIRDIIVVREISYETNMMTERVLSSISFIMIMGKRILITLMFTETNILYDACILYAKRFDCWVIILDCRFWLIQFSGFLVLLKFDNNQLE